MTFEDYKREQLKNPDFKQAYDDLEPEYQLIKELINYRNENKISQQKFAELVGMDRADVSKLENGNANPSLKTLKKIAHAMGRKLQISFA